MDRRAVAPQGSGWQCWIDGYHMTSIIDQGITVSCLFTGGAVFLIVTFIGRAIFGKNLTTGRGTRAAWVWANWPKTELQKFELPLTDIYHDSSQSVEQFMQFLAILAPSGTDI